MIGAFCIVDNSDTLYLEGPNSLQYPFVVMGEKLVLSLHKRDHNSTVVVKHDPCFLSAALLYQVKTVRLN